jgi:hypothetical protein
MSVQDHINRYPNARPSTLAYLAERERLHEQMRAELAKLRRKEKLERLKRVLMPWRL